MNYFCTFFDFRYLSKGLALYRSLLDQCPSFHLWILAMDQQTFELLSKLMTENVTILRFEDLDKDDPRLGMAKKNRSLVECYFTCKPFLCLYILKQNSEVDLITYLDADLFFFSNPQGAVNHLEGYSIGLTGHHFSSHLKENEQYGIYNAGWVSFRRDDAGLAGLNWWRDRCLEWCYDRVEDQKYADQKYLNVLPGRFKRVRDIQPHGVNLAPWNIEGHQISMEGGNVFVDGKNLVAFHFHDLREIFPIFFDSGFAMYQIQLTSAIRDFIYLPYLKILSEESCKVPSYLLKQKAISIRGEKTRFKGWFLLFPSGFRFLKGGKRLLKCLYTHSYIIFRNGLMN